MIFQERHWTSPAMATVLQAATNAPQSDRLKQAMRIAPHLLDMYFAIALRDVNDCMLLFSFEPYEIISSSKLLLRHVMC